MQPLSNFRGRSIIQHEKKKAGLQSATSGSQDLQSATSGSEGLPAVSSATLYSLPDANARRVRYGDGRASYSLVPLVYWYVGTAATTTQCDLVAVRLPAIFVLCDHTSIFEKGNKKPFSSSQSHAQKMPRNELGPLTTSNNKRITNEAYLQHLRRQIAVVDADNASKRAAGELLTQNEGVPSFWMALPKPCESPNPNPICLRVSTSARTVLATTATEARIQRHQKATPTVYTKLKHGRRREEAPPQTRRG